LDRTSVIWRKNLSAIIDKALVRNPKDRFPDAGKLLAAMR
jgi:hypothetical protein